MVAEDGIRGVTSNPTIFQKAIASSNDYDGLIRAAAPADTDAKVLERLMVGDLALACDKLRPVYDESGGVDGFASIEVSPAVARDCAGSVEQARRLWKAVQRPNLMVKIPGARAAVPAIESCLTHGININITLLFSVQRYREVIEAYLRALEARVACHDPIDHIASVASFFVSRVDAKVDKALAALPNALRDASSALRGQIGIANARIAYEQYQRIYASDRWKELASRGAHPQRLLWASTTPKDPAYPDVYYVEALVGPDTIDTMTPDCIRAYLDHGEPRSRLSSERSRANEQMERLMTLGIDFARIAEELEDEGIAAFADSYGKALKSVAEKRRAPVAEQTSS
jgi:transaldolase